MNITLEKEIENVRVVDADRKYWFIRTYGGITFRDFSERNYVGIGFNKVPFKLLENAKPGNIEDFNLLRNYIVNNSDYSGGVATRWANQLIIFHHKIKKGDLVIIPEKNSTHYSIGIIESDVYVVDDTRTFEHNNDFIRFPEKRRKVRWERNLTKRELKRDLPLLSSGQQAITNINKYGENLESYISNIFIKEDKAYLTLRVNQNEDINAFAFRDFLDGLTFFYKEFCKEHGFKNENELYIKIKVQSKGKLDLRGFVKYGILSLGGLVLLTNNNEFKATLGRSNIEFKNDGLLKSVSDFLNEKQERIIKYEKFKDSIKALEVKQNLSLKKNPTSQDVEIREEDNGQDESE